MGLSWPVALHVDWQICQQRLFQLQAWPTEELLRYKMVMENDVGTAYELIALQCNQLDVARAYTYEIGFSFCHFCF